MKTTLTIGRRGSRLALLAAAVAAVFLATTPAHARGHSSSGSGPRGSISRRVERSGGNAVRSTTVTNAAGQTVSHSYNRTVDPTSGSVAVSASTTLPDGRTTSRNFARTRTDTGRTRSGCER